MGVKAKLEKIEKKLKEEKANIENPTRGDLSLMKHLIAIKDINEGKKSKEIKPERLKKIWEKEYYKFNGDYKDFINHLIGAIQARMRKIIEEPEK